ncbi:DUF3035 domain-containing protein [Rhodobacteraceae bacterium WD3A24]|nr:DUF3035 domain-containing protein [Rhodobacteraceae bacterium WD3A24]
MRFRHGILALAGIAALAACSGPETPRLMNASSATSGPDEFGIVPNRPLEMPQDMATLPAPDPGGTNRTDPSPQADAVAALGGAPQAGSAAGDRPILEYATRFGVVPNIRERLAAEDLAFRRENDGRLLERVFNVNVYYRAYEQMSLDQQAELARWRARGVTTPAAPPDPESDGG